MNNDVNNSQTNQQDAKAANLDPITHEMGAHPLGTGVGAAGAGAVATVVGSVVGGPVGALVGAVVGSVVGGLAGKSTAEKINPTLEENYWRENYANLSYAEPDVPYEDYQPAYRMGYESYDRYAHTGRPYADLEPEIKSDYERIHGTTGLSWDKAKNAVKDAWDRAANSVKA